MQEVLSIYNYANNFFINKIGGADTDLERYSKHSYKAILELTGDILKLSNDEHFSRGSKIILKTIIEIAVDLENLLMVKNYEKIIEVISIKEEVSFIKYYNDKFKTLINDSNNYDNKKIKKLKLKIEELLGDIKVDYETITKTYYKFNLLSDRKRHEKYKIFFDIMALYCHNNIHAFKKGGIKKIRDIDIEEYKDIIASILKNGIISLAKIYDVEKKVDKDLLRELKDDIKGDKDGFNLKSIFDNYSMLREYEFE